jgi:hypothetical protein
MRDNRMHLDILRLSIKLTTDIKRIRHLSNLNLSTEQWVRSSERMENSKKDKRLQERSTGKRSNKNRRKRKIERLG